MHFSPNANHQIGQYKQRVQLSRVVGQALVAHLHFHELTLDQPDRVFDLGTDARVDPLPVASRSGAHLRTLIQRLALARRKAACQLTLILGCVHACSYPSTRVEKDVRTLSVRR